MVSSDALEMDDGNVALITYWEVRTSQDLDVYRCIDLVNSALRAMSQECWTALRAGTSLGAVTEDVTSSDDICGRPDDAGDISDAAYCSFSRPFEIQTPYFSVVVEPLEGGSLVAVTDEGRTLVITSPPRVSELFFEVRVTNRRDRTFFADTETTADVLELANDETQCELRAVSNRRWAACQLNDTPSIATYYLVQDELLYEASFNRAAPDEIRARLDRILTTIDPSAGED